jgi:hypothetical protein
MKHRELLQLVLAVVSGPFAALATPITYTMTATATGTLAGTPFTAAAIQVTSIADTNDVFVAGTVPDFIFEVHPASSTISIAGFGTHTFTDQMFWQDPNGSGDIIFGDVVAGHAVLGFTKLFSGLESYDLKSSFGPVSSSIDFVTMFFDGFNNIPTSGGSLSLQASDDTFLAVAAPEPVSCLLAGLGLLFLKSRPRSKG